MVAVPIFLLLRIAGLGSAKKTAKVVSDLMEEFEV